MRVEEVEAEIVWSHFRREEGLEVIMGEKVKVEEVEARIGQSRFQGREGGLEVKWQVRVTIGVKAGLVVDMVEIWQHKVVMVG